MKRISFLVTALLLAINIMAQDHVLWYGRPATDWLEALPIGNSHLGAMVYGGTVNDEIQLNEETFWSGSPHNNNSSESLEYLPEVRKLIFGGTRKRLINSSRSISLKVLTACATSLWAV